MGPSLVKRSQRTRGFAPSHSPDRKSTRLNSSHTEIYTLSLHDALPILRPHFPPGVLSVVTGNGSVVGETLAKDPRVRAIAFTRSEEHTSELQSHRDLHSFPTRRSSDLEAAFPARCAERRHRQWVRRW